MSIPSVQLGLRGLRAALQGGEGAPGAAAGDAGHGELRAGGRTGPRHGPRQVAGCPTGAYESPKP